jgi:hypothetical protein
MTQKGSRLRQKTLADQIARLTGGVASINPKHVQGEPVCGYRVTLHRRPFWFSARISDEEFVVEANHQRGPGENDSFGAYLFDPWYNEFPEMRLRALHRTLSLQFGFKVYVAKPFPMLLDKQPSLAQNKAAASAILCRRELRSFIVRLRKDHYRRFFLCDRQMIVIGPIVSPEDVARRLLMLREMIEVVYRCSKKIRKAR